jgi:crotonobetainyl-CoA:carnitine CoA-transferase CaiB-like acyl-CoA transferase
VAEVQRVLLEGGAKDWLEKLESAEVPCAPVLSMPEALQQRSVAGAVVSVADARRGELRMIGSPIHIEGVEPSYEAPPRAGEHTAKILAGPAGGGAGL